MIPTVQKNKTQCNMVFIAFKSAAWLRSLYLISWKNDIIYIWLNIYDKKSVTVRLRYRYLYVAYRRSCSASTRLYYFSLFAFFMCKGFNTSLKRKTVGGSKIPSGMKRWTICELSASACKGSENYWIGTKTWRPEMVFHFRHYSLH